MTAGAIGRSTEPASDQQRQPGQHESSREPREQQRELDEGHGARCVLSESAISFLTPMHRRHWTIFSANALRLWFGSWSAGVGLSDGLGVWYRGACCGSWECGL